MIKTTVITLNKSMSAHIQSNFKSIPDLPTPPVQKHLTPFEGQMNFESEGIGYKHTPSADWLCNSNLSDFSEPQFSFSLNGNNKEFNHSGWAIKIT